jgi:polyphosphate kinase 2
MARKAGKAKGKSEGKSKAEGMAEGTVAAGTGSVATTENDLPAEQPEAAGAGVDDKPRKLSRKTYDQELERLHVELVKLQQWVVHQGLKVCVVFEGRDGAGKGGTIKAITERVSPRVFRVVALPAPSDREKSQMYLQRYAPHWPAAGEIMIFDRSWYNRAGVERVMGFSDEATVKKFLMGVPLIEKAMVDSGIILLKYWLEVSPEEQTRRLEARINDGRKIWKLSPMDLKSYSRWYDYSRARDDMFAATDRDFAPWFVARSDDKKRARLNIISRLLEQIPYKALPREKVRLPKRQKPGDYVDPRYPFKYVEERF